MHKIYIVLIYTIPILFIFGFTKNIHWIYALSLSAGNALGAWVSVKTSIKMGEGIVKVILCVAILLMATKLLLTF